VFLLSIAFEFFINRFEKLFKCFKNIFCFSCSGCRPTPAARYRWHRTAQACPTGSALSPDLQPQLRKFFLSHLFQVLSKFFFVLHFFFFNFYSRGYFCIKHKLTSNLYVFIISVLMKSCYGFNRFLAVLRTDLSLGL